VLIGLNPVHEPFFTTMSADEATPLSRREQRSRSEIIIKATEVSQSQAGLKKEQE
jgi:hypothetical protein